MRVLIELDLALRLTIGLALLCSASAFAQPGLPPRSSVPAVNEATASSSIADLQRLFENPPEDSKIMMRWWWFGPAVTKPELEREMQWMKEGGMTVPLVLEPYGSRVLAFSKRALPHRPVRRASKLPSPIDLSTGWRVSFGPNTKLVRMDRLRSWAEDAAPDPRPRPVSQLN